MARTTQAVLTGGVLNPVQQAAYLVEAGHRVRAEAEVPSAALRILLEHAGEKSVINRENG